MHPQFTLEREASLAPVVLDVLVQRILARVEFDTNGMGCWLWPGVADDYGRIRCRPMSPLLVHRLMFAATRGAIPRGALVLHHCDTRPCCRPDHLFLGDHAANSQDCAAKGRFFLQRHGEVYRGERNPAAKLADVQVQELRVSYAAGASSVDLATRFGIHPSHVWRLTHPKAGV